MHGYIPRQSSVVMQPNPLAEQGKAILAFCFERGMECGVIPPGVLVPGGGVVDIILPKGASAGDLRKAIVRYEQMADDV